MMCVECGREVAGLIDGSCTGCYVAKHSILVVPDVVDLEVCAHCGARRQGNLWHDVDPSTPEAWLREDTMRGNVRLHEGLRDITVETIETPQDAKHFAHEIHVSGVLEGVPVEGSASALLRTRRGVCDLCSRQAGGYWAALIQLRATDREVRSMELERAHKIVAEAIHHARQAGNRLAFLQKEGPQHGGWDYYLGDIDTGRAASRLLSQRLGGRTTETAKLVGRREGEDVYRVTFLVRIELFAPGDIAETSEGLLLLVHRVVKDRIQGIRMDDHRPAKVPLQGSRRLGGRELVQEAVLVSQAPSDLQVLDPVTLRTVDVPRPEGFSADQAIRVVRHDGRLWPVPDQSSNTS